MINSFLIILTDLFAGLTFGVCLTNLSTTIISRYAASLPESASFDPDDAFIQSILTSAILVGGMIGALYVTSLADKIGRKKTALTFSIICVATSIMSLIPVSWVYLAVARLIVGVPMGAMTTVVPMWMSELVQTDPKLRGMLTVGFQLFVCTGIVFAYFVALIDSWRIPLSLTFFFSIGAAICMYKLPPSPEFTRMQNRQQGKKNDEDRAQGTGSGVLGDDDSESNDQDDLAILPASALTWGAMFRSKRYRRSLLVALLFPAMQQLSGINSIIMYAPSVFEMAGASESAAQLWGPIGVSIWNLLTTIIAIPLVERLGRRMLTFGGLLGVVVGDALFTLCYGVSLSQSLSTVLLFMALIVFLLGFEVGPGPMFYTYVSEAFPLSIRSKLNGLAFFTNWVCNLLVVITFPFFKSAAWVAFMIYGLCGVVTGFFLWGLLPETKGRTMTEIEAEMLDDGASLLIDKDLA